MRIIAPCTRHGEGALGENGELDFETESGRPIRDGGIRCSLRRLDPAYSSAVDHGRARRYASPSVCQACVAKFAWRSTRRTTTCRATWSRKRTRKKIEAQVTGFKFELKQYGSKAAETTSALKAAKSSPPRTGHQPLSGKRRVQEKRTTNPRRKAHAMHKILVRAECC